MMKSILVIFILLMTKIAFAQQQFDIELEKVPVNIQDMSSIKSGAKFFAQNCMSCHSLIYLRYDPIAQEAGILYDKMPLQVTSWPNGIKPPDLSLEANRRGVDWIYTYLHSFYLDPSRPTGVNNLLVPKTGMPDMIVAYQGEQILVQPPQRGAKMFDSAYHWYDLVALQTQGGMSPDQFDAVMTDLVNFLGYASNPYQVEQQNLGYWVIGFIVIFFLFAWCLKHSYWKKIKRLRGG